MEPDISILRKTGHFYFALTAREDFTVNQTLLGHSTTCARSAQRDFQARHSGGELTSG